MAILDFSKAFDMVPHRRLMSKLDYYLRGNIHTWISTFLINRKQSVVIDGVSSPQIAVDSGVPQGTVLRPILFLAPAVTVVETEGAMDSASVLVFSSRRHRR